MRFFPDSLRVARVCLLASLCAGVACADDPEKEEEKEIRIMLSGASEERRAASHALTDRGQASLTQVLELWNSVRFDARVWGIRTVARMGAPVLGLLPRFLEVMKWDKDGLVRAEALDGAVKLASGRPEVRTAVLEALADGSDEVRLSAVAPLSGWRDELTSEALLARRSERSDDEFAKQIAAALRMLLHDSNGTVRLNVIYRWRGPSPGYSRTALPFAKTRLRLASKASRSWTSPSRRATLRVAPGRPAGGPFMKPASRLHE